MPFKIVQTRENNRSVLTVVPSNWEKDGVLYWPRKLSDNKQIHNENSTPGTDWKPMSCRTKRVMHSLEEANAEVERMAQISDTENEFDSPTPTPRPRNKMGTHVLEAVDLNDQIAALNYVDHRSEPSCAKASSASFFQSSDHKRSIQKKIINSDSAQLTRTDSPSGTTSCLISIAESQSRDRISSAFTPVSNYISPATSGSLSSITPVNFEPQVTYDNEPILITFPSQKGFSEGTAASSCNRDILGSNEQNSVVVPNNLLMEIKQKLAVLQATVDSLFVHVLNQSKAAPLNNTVSNESAVIKPASSRQELEKLEDFLKNECNFSSTVSAMNFICGTSGKSKGLDSCYKLIDYFFTRDLLLFCSWTGTSRQNDKIPLKYYYNTRKCFLCLVRKADNDFSEQECDKFFKTIIKNAKQRMNPKIMSATKHRAKKTGADQVQPESSQENINEERQQEANVEQNENREESQLGEERSAADSAGVEQVEKSVNNQEEIDAIQEPK
ncbi:uncharacterized protein LOC126381311 [Pectinophora gossypiella]|uniref:uncharacterized protein LOC126381311 n=1 Tax=Pectinophora gossypiella TaxID=13191 RepID=UPI00214F5067|nr:uncharacterized protein LOC126381311 [Pectinophora gossypiella]